MLASPMARTTVQKRKAASYHPPEDARAIALGDLLHQIGRAPLSEKQLDMLRDSRAADARVTLHYAGDLGLLSRPAVAIVGTRDVTEQGRRRAGQLARDLAQAQVSVVSGLAKGVDAAAHAGAIEAGGKTVAVIGTPLSKAYPIENAALQESIYAKHLLISPFAEGATVFRGNFPVRNRVMAAVSDATVIVEASDTSGTLHQAAECQRLGRWLFIMKSVVDDKSLQWPARFIGKPFVEILSRTEDLLARVL